jgi:alcohol dehydrogenase
MVIADTRLVPRMAALDPCLMTGLPPAITAATGMDALTHAVEAYIGQWGTEYTDSLALAAVAMIYRNCRTPTPTAQPGRARADGAGLHLRRHGLHPRQRRQRARHRAPVGCPLPHAARPGQRDACWRRCCASPASAIEPRLARLAEQAGLAPHGRSRPSRPGQKFIDSVEAMNLPAGHSRTLDALREADIPAGRCRLLGGRTPTTRCRG